MICEKVFELSAYGFHTSLQQHLQSILCNSALTRKLRPSVNLVSGS